MAQIIKAPSAEKPWFKTVFLAGGITNCEDWQKEVEKHLFAFRVSVFNPRRVYFDVNDKTASAKQVKWEFSKLEETDIFSMYFCSGVSVQPICMYELGRNIVRMQQRFPGSWQNRIVVSVEDGYLRAEDVVLQLGLCAPQIKVNMHANPCSHAMLIGNALNTLAHENPRNERLEIFREVEHGFHVQDAVFHVEEYLENIGYDPETFEGSFDYDFLAEMFEEKKDCNVADNVLWNDIIMSYIAANEIRL